MTPFQRLPSNSMVTGSTEAIIAAFFPQQANEHVKVWREHHFRAGNYHYWPEYSNRIVYGARAPQ